MPSPVIAQQRQQENGATRESSGSKTGKAGFADNRRSTALQLQQQSMIGESAHVAQLRKTVSAITNGQRALSSVPVKQLKKFKPASTTDRGAAVEDVWLASDLQIKGHLFERSLPDSADRQTLIKNIAAAAETIGGTLGAKPKWVKTAAKYNKPADEVAENDPFRVRIWSRYPVSGGRKITKLDYHFGPYNHGYVVNVQDHGKNVPMEARGQLTDTSAGSAASYSNQHHDTEGTRLLNISDSPGASPQSNEQAFDATTKMAGEGARFQCVKNHLGNLVDTTFFFTKTGPDEVMWTPFHSLWLTWSGTFGKKFGILDSKVKAAIKGDKLKKAQGAKIARNVGKPSDITTGFDYNLDASRAATEQDKVATRA